MVVTYQPCDSLRCLNIFKCSFLYSLNENSKINPQELFWRSNVGAEVKMEVTREGGFLLPSSSFLPLLKVFPLIIVGSLCPTSQQSIRVLEWCNSQDMIGYVVTNNPTSSAAQPNKTLFLAYTPCLRQVWVGRPWPPEAPSQWMYPQLTYWLLTHLLRSNMLHACSYFIGQRHTARPNFKRDGKFKPTI